MNAFGVLGVKGLLLDQRIAIIVFVLSPLLERNQTLLHEVFHIISESFRCSLDEDTVERLANGMGEFLFDNLGIEFDWGDIKKSAEH